MGQIKTSVIVNLIDRVTNPIKRTKAAIESLGKMPGVTQGFNRLGQKTEQVTNQLRGLGGLRNVTGGITSGVSRATGALVGFGTGILKLAGVAAGAVGAMGFGINRLFIGTAASFEKYRTQLEVLEGSSAKAKTAMDWVSKFATDTPFEIDGVMQSFVKLRAFGMDPMNGTMQAIADQTAKLGGGQQEMEGIVLALGQAWTKQKLQGEEALQLIERGVPVWDLLAKATGKTTAELQKMSEKGQLGKHAISLLIEEMGKSSAGAANKQMQTWNGMVSNLSDTWTRFANLVAEAGMFDALKGHLAGFLATLERMAASGQLAVIAKQVSDGVISALGMLGSLGRGIGQIFGIVAPVVRALVAPIGSVKEGINALSSGLVAYLTVAAPYFKGLVLTLWAVAKVVFTIAVWIGKVLVGAVQLLMTVLSPVVSLFEMLGKLVNAVFDRIDQLAGTGIMDSIGKATASLMAGLGVEEAGNAIITNEAAKFAPPDGVLKNTKFAPPDGVLKNTKFAPSDGVLKNTKFAPPVGVSNAPKGGKADVGGTIGITIRQDGKAVVDSIKPNNPAVDYAVDRGPMMVGM